MRLSVINRFVYALMAILVGYFAFLPVCSVIIYGLVAQQKMDIPFASVSRALTHLGHSLQIALCVTVLATVIGVIMAFTFVRIEFWGKKALKLLSLIPLIHAPFVGSLSYIMLFGRRGLITHRLLGLDVSPFGWQGIVVMQTLGLGAMAYLVVSSALTKLDTTLEDAARNMGAKESKILTTITLPLMLPEIINAALLVFLASMADFGTPLIIGGSFQTLASDLYIQITGLYNMPSAAISGIFLLFPCVLAFLAQQWLVRQKNYYSTRLSAKEMSNPYLPKAIKYGCILITTLFLLFVLLKYAFIVVGALTKNWGYDYTLTFDHFKVIDSRTFRPFINSIKLASIVAFITSGMGVYLAWLIQKHNLRGRHWVDFMATLPAAVPGILFGIGYLVTFRYPILGIGGAVLPTLRPIILLGTSVIVYLICIYRYLYMGLRTGYATLSHIDPQLMEAACDLGAQEGYAFRTVNLPLLKPAFTAAFIKTFTTTMTTLGAIIFLLMPANKVAVQQIFQVITSSATGEAAAMVVLLSLITLLLLGLFHIVFNIKSFWLRIKHLINLG